jgi:hypothetical protein
MANRRRAGPPRAHAAASRCGGNPLYFAWRAERVRQVALMWLYVERGPQNSTSSSSISAGSAFASSTHSTIAGHSMMLRQ